MSKLTEYTLELYKADKRTKEGRRLVAVQDFDAVTKDYIDAVVQGKQKLGFIVDLHETYVTRVTVHLAQKPTGACDVLGPTGYGYRGPFGGLSNTIGL